MTENQRIKILRKKAGLSQVSLAKAMGVDQSTISAVESGKNNATKNFKILLSHILNISINEIESNYDLNNDSINNIESNASIISDDPQTIDLPLITINARASFKYEVFQDSNNTVNETAPIYKTRVKGLKKPVIIEIDGDSMEPQLSPGARVLGDEIDSGDWIYTTGVVAVSFKNQFVVKRIKSNNSIETNLIMLHSDNEKGGSFPIRLEDIKVMWKVIEIVRAKVE